MSDYTGLGLNNHDINHKCFHTLLYHKRFCTLFLYHYLVFQHVNNMKDCCLIQLFHYYCGRLDEYKVTDEYHTMDLTLY